MSQQHELELQAVTPAPVTTRQEVDGADHPENSHTISTLPRADGGRAAWTILLSAFVFEALLWGFPLSFGVFQNYYSQIPEFKGDPFIAVVGTTASGISYLPAPIVIPFIKRFSTYRRPMIWIGWPLCLLGLLAGSFARTPATLIFTQGVMYGVGFSIFYYPIISMVNEYWIARRGMAYGVLCSASGVSGAVMPFCINALLRNYGYPTTLRVMALGLCLGTAPLIFLLKGRTNGEGAASRTDWSFLKAPRFWIYNVSNFAMGLGYFFPSLYLPSYASSNGLSTTDGAILLKTMSISQVLGQMSFGYLSDGKLPLDTLAISSTLVASAAVYGCWGVAHSIQALIAFSLIYGFSAAGYTALWGRMGTSVSNEPTGAFAAFGFLNFGKGVGNILSGPVGGALLKEMVHVGSYGSTKYESVILFTGSCMIVSSATIVLSYFREWGQQS